MRRRSDEDEAGEGERYGRSVLRTVRLYAVRPVIKVSQEPRSSSFICRLSFLVPVWRGYTRQGVFVSCLDRR